MALALPGYDFNSLTGLRTKKKQPWEVALGARSAGLNQRYGLGGSTPPPGAAPGGGGGGSSYGSIGVLSSSEPGKTISGTQPPARSS